MRQSVRRWRILTASLLMHRVLQASMRRRSSSRTRSSRRRRQNRRLRRRRRKKAAQAAAAAGTTGSTTGTDASTAGTGTTLEYDRKYRFDRDGYLDFGQQSPSGSSTGLTDGGLNPSYTTGVSGSDVVSYASQFLGNPYVLGGTSLTSGTDCSYFVMAVYQHFGISLPRSSYS